MLTFGHEELKRMFPALDVIPVARGFYMPSREPGGNVPIVVEHPRQALGIRGSAMREDVGSNFVEVLHGPVMDLENRGEGFAQVTRLVEDAMQPEEVDPL